MSLNYGMMALQSFLKLLEHVYYVLLVTYLPVGKYVGLPAIIRLMNAINAQKFW